MSFGKTFLVFSAGVAFGGFLTWKLLKKKYEEIAQEEIDSVKEAFNRDRLECCEEKEVDATQIVNSKTEMHEDNRYLSIVKENYACKPSARETKNEKNYYVISPDDFGDIYEYSKTTLTYYADGVVADQLDRIVDDYEDIIGSDFADHFGEYEDDSVFIRNDAVYSDYEILRDNRNYADIYPDFNS